MVSVRIYSQGMEQSGSFGTVWGEESGSWGMLNDLLIRDTGTGLDALSGFSTKHLSQRNGSESTVTKWLSMTRQFDTNGKIKACTWDPWEQVWVHWRDLETSSRADNWESLRAFILTYITWTTFLSLWSSNLSPSSVSSGTVMCPAEWLRVILVIHKQTGGLAFVSSWAVAWCLRKSKALVDEGQISKP